VPSSGRWTAADLDGDVPCRLAESRRIVIAYIGDTGLPGSVFFVGGRAAERDRRSWLRRGLGSPTSSNGLRRQVTEAMQVGQ